MPPSAQRRRILNKGIDDDRPLYALLRRPSLVLAFLVMLVVSFAGIWMYQLFFVAFGSLESSPRVQVLEPGPLPAREKKLSGRPPIQARGGDVVAAAEDDPPNKSNENKDIRNGNVNNVISEPISASHGGDGGGGGFSHFNSIAQDLAALEDPADVLGRLEGDDPFGTRKFDSELLQRETDLGRVLSVDEMRQLFPCPDNERRITLPDARMEQKARDFRNAKRGTFLFFQHLRKAGGTNFCSLAERNLPQSARPHYYCMPDMGWSGNKNAGYLHSWSNKEIITRMEDSGYRIAGNEWENFDVKRHFDLPAVFATSFRKPLDRALSQFRFECIEDRGCRIKDIHKWWDQRTDLWNVYTNTFADGATMKKHLRGGNYSNERRNSMAVAIDTLSKFNIVLSMEWLAYAGPQVQSILGFDDISALTTRVRPHITQAKRDDGQDKNNLGSASIAKASWVSKEYLDPDQYKKMSENLALDEIFTDVARRMFLERLVCEDTTGGGVAL